MTDEAKMLIGFMNDCVRNKGSIRKVKNMLCASKSMFGPYTVSKVTEYVNKNEKFNEYLIRKAESSDIAKECVEKIRSAYQV